MALVVLLASCSSMPPVQESVLPPAPPLSTMIFLVHGDADYAYYDAEGRGRQADEDIVREAQAIAGKNPRAEVFIFHEIERRHFLFIFPRRDGRAYHYRNGRLVNERSYWRDQGDSRFAQAVRMYADWSVPGPPAPTRVLLYFGHELPESPEARYDESYPERQVAIDDLAQGVSVIADASGVLDLLVLSTCFGGTPRTIGSLAPYARYIIASPENLHLSYFDLEPLNHPGVDANGGATADFAEEFAVNAFDVLTREVQTVVSVVVYETASLRPYLDSVTEAYASRLSTASTMPDSAFVRCDCAEDSAFASPLMGDGLTVLYRAPRFGRLKNTPAHSGWACWRPAS